MLQHKSYKKNLLGDKSSVTVMGHGTGAACLHYLMTSDALPHGKYNGDQ